MVNMRSFYMVLFLVVVMMAGLCGQSIGFPLKAIDDRNKEIEFSTRPLRIVSLAPTNTELLYALGLEQEIVGVTSYCDYPAAAKNKEKVGGFAKFDIDKICALKPDLILAFGTIQLPTVEALEQRGQKVFWIYPHTMKDILNSFERVGAITGATQEARLLRVAVEKEMSALQNMLGAIYADKRPSIYRVMGFNPPATIGAVSFQTDIFNLAGGKNAFPDAGKDFFELDAQELIKRDPDVILVCGDDEKEWKQKLKDSPVYGKLTAVRKDAILVIPCDLTCKPGPRVAELARRIALYLYPALKRSVMNKDALSQTR